MGERVEFDSGVKFSVLIVLVLSSLPSSLSLLLIIVVPKTMSVEVIITAFTSNSIKNDVGSNTLHYHY